MNIKTLKDEIKVNENDLQGEWAKQATLFLKYSLKMSKLIHERDNRRRELANSLLNGVENFRLKGEKLSEAALKRMLDSDEDIIEMQYQIDTHKNAVQAFEHKKKALEYETQLLIGGFFAEPKEKKPIKRKGGYK
jgi:hypothetical protein|tara:strand:+ start:1164 stop:1568 length:405 start_codon:yes stop_codon:yes gene_type:complete